VVAKVNNEISSSSERSTAGTKSSGAPDETLTEAQESDAGTKASTIAKHALAVALSVDVVLDSISSHQCDKAPAVHTAFNSCDLCEPWRLFQPVAGKFVGSVSTGMLKTSVFADRSEKCPEIKGDFHEANIAVKHAHKALFCWAFRNLRMSPIHAKTMTAGSNHSACGEVCGDETEVSNG